MASTWWEVGMAFSREFLVLLRSVPVPEGYQVRLCVYGPRAGQVLVAREVEGGELEVVLHCESEAAFLEWVASFVAG
jgi:hypothetical protein